MLTTNNFISQLKYIENKWIINNKYYSLTQLTQFYINQILKIGNYENKIVFLGEEEPDKFISIFFASVMTNSCLFLLNPQWQKKELEQVFQLAKPDIIFGSIIPLKGNKTTDKRFSGIMIPTGGTSGKIKFAIHTWTSLNASVTGFSNYWHKKKINSFCCLPLHHVSGLMQILRSFITKGNLEIVSYQNLKTNQFLSKKYSKYFISLVPTQLKYLLDNNLQFLKQFETVLVGGSATNNDLKHNCRKHKIRLALTYGMTETASGISALKPEDFLKNNDSSGEIMPHAKVLINSQSDPNINKSNNPHLNSLSLDKNKLVGNLHIKSQSLFQGYYPSINDNHVFKTDDLGYFDNNYLYIVGRNSQKIISGGENIYPLEIEQLILETQLVKDVIVKGKKDDYWGEIVTAIYIPLSEDIDVENIKKMMLAKVSSYKIPKLWLKVNHIPRNAQGKISRDNI